jgi:hypothetical protein
MDNRFVWLVADGWCWFVLIEKYWWLVVGGWFVLREKYYWLVADKPSEQGGSHGLMDRITGSDHSSAVPVVPINLPNWTAPGRPRVVSRPCGLSGRGRTIVTAAVNRLRERY